MSEASPRPRTIHILVVDDEPALRRSTRRLLEADGHVVYEAGDGVEAMDVIRCETVDLVITDLNMPRMNGQALLERLKERRPVPALIAMTGAGWDDAALRSVAGVIGGATPLSKPYTRDELRAAVVAARA